MRVIRGDVVALGVFALVLAGFGWQGLAGDGGGLRAVQDHTITLSLSRQLATYQEYHPDFVYPLPAVVLKLALGTLGDAASSLLWMALLIAAGLACAEALARLTAPAHGPGGRYAAPLAGALAVVYCVQWDFRAVNVNTFFVALVLWSVVCMARRSDAAAGALLAASVGLKLYSAPLLLYPVLLRAPRVLAWAGLGVLVLFALVPVLWFGPADAVHLSGLWLDRLRATAAPEVASTITAYDVSLLRAVRVLLGQTGGVVTPVAAAVARGIGLVFAAAVAAWLVRAHRATGRRGGEGSCDGGAARAVLLTDVGLVLAAVLLLSPLVQPHHGVLLWPLAAATARLALEPGAGQRDRAVAGAILGAVCVALLAALSGAVKAVALQGAVLALAAGGVRAATALAADARPVAGAARQ